MFCRGSRLVALVGFRDDGSFLSCSAFSGSRRVGLIVFEVVLRNLVAVLQVIDRMTRDTMQLDRRSQIFQCSAPTF